MPLFAPATSGAAKVYSSTSDPGVSNDNTQGYAVGSLGINTNTGRVFTARSVSTGAAAWDPLGPAAHPGFVASNWYFPPACTGGALGTQATAFVSGSIYSAPIWIPERMTIGALAARVTTLDASGNVILALYNNDTSPVNRPGTLLSSTALTGISVASTGNISASLLAAQQVEPGWYWLAAQANSTVVRMTCYLNTSAVVATLLGSATLANVTNSGGTGVINGVSTTGTFGTLPTQHGATFTEIFNALQVPAIWFQPSSVP